MPSIRLLRAICLPVVAGVVLLVMLSASGGSTADAAENSTRWAGGWRAELSGRVARATQAENLAIVYSEPLSGKFYIEASLLIDDDDGGPIGSIGIWNNAGTPRDSGEWANIGQLYGSQSCGVVNDGADTLFALTNGEGYKAPPAVYVDEWPVVRYGIAGDAATGKIWIRQVWSGGVGVFIGGGSPANGTSPTSEPALPGGAPRIAAGIPVGARATIHAPSEHYGAAPAGFTAR